MWLSSSCLLACVLGNVSALCIRLLAALILCLMSWCELKSRYLSVCVGFLSTSILRLLPCRVISVSKREILLSSSSSIVKEILGSMLFKELRKLVISNNRLFNHGKTVVKQSVSMFLVLFVSFQ